MIETDSYGGKKLFKSKASGFFRLSRVNGQWWFITPEGNPFLSIGVSYTLSDGDYAPKLKCSPYKDNILKKHGSVESWVAETTRRFREWGFNTRGGWSSDEVKIPDFFLTFYTHNRWRYGKMADFFSYEFAAYADKTASKETRPDDPLLIGYFLDNEMQWDTDWRLGPSMFDYYLRLPAGSAGKKAFVEFFKAKYTTVERLAKVWWPSFRKWNELYRAKFLFAKPAAHSLAQTDKEEFTLAVARQYYKVSTQAIRKHDKNHLIAASRFVSWTTPAVVLIAAGEYCDVISINHYEIGPVGKFLVQLLNWRHSPVYAPGASDLSFAQWRRFSARPLLITEFSFRADDTEMPNTIPPSFINPTVPTQKVRAERYKQCAGLWAGQPCFTGYHWFRLMDEPKEGRWDGENGNYGLVNVKDEPYETFVSSAAKTNSDVWQIHHRSENTSVIDEAVCILRDSLREENPKIIKKRADKDNNLYTAARSLASEMLDVVNERVEVIEISGDTPEYESSGLVNELREIADSKLPIIGTGVPGIIFKVEKTNVDGDEVFILKKWP